ncbi:hypothetical protein TNCV_2841771 [Trichonephila clavipes]|uniref:Uncharacterized protein n=1 Tax=Trichonephila clavipes TaxID=2585209 RepID=A0A8X6RZ48_TRICX|nr:hypothetical protein TNCV_2841771 [Trichonephila clavipes]
MLAGYSPQSFLIYFSDMGWRLASRAICPDNVTVVTVAKPYRQNLDIPAETVLKKILDLKTTPTCHVRTTNKDTLSQAGPPTQGLSNNLDMGWRNASRSISQ